MEARAPYSGGSVQAGGAAEPTTERLQEVARLLADRKPWPAFLHAGLASDCPENVREALAWMASGAVGLLNVASVGPLVPVCEAFKGLIQAAEGAAEADEKLRELISWCVSLTEVLFQHGKEVDGLAPVMTPLNAFVSTTNELAKRAKTLAARGKCTALLCNWRDRKQIQEFEEKLRNVWTDIQGVTMLTFHADFRRGLPPKTGEMAEVPQNARVAPPAFVERSDLVGAVVQDLVATDRATKKAHVLRGIPGGGKTVAASAVLRCEDVRRSFQDGIFWVQVGQVGTCNPLALLKGLAEDLAHAPSNRPHTVPHEFRDVDHVISHLEGVRKQGNLRCLIVLDDVWDTQMVPLFLRPGFHCLVTTRDLAVVPRHLRGTCTAVDVLTETEALKLLKEASRASSSIPRDEGVKVADDCGFLPLAVAIIGAMGSLRADPLSPETWRRVHARLVEEPTLVQDHVGGALAVSFRELNENARTRFRKLGVLVRGVRAPVDMVAHLWEQDPSDTILLLSDLVDKSLVKVVEQSYYRHDLVDKSLVKVVEQSYYLHDLVLDFAKDELRKSRGKVQLVTSRQAQYLGTISVLEDYARAGEVLRGFYALMALWQSVEDMSGDKQLEVSTYGVKLKALEGSEPMESVAYTNWAAGRLFELQGKYSEAEPLYERSQAIREKVLGPEHPDVAASLNNRAGLLEAQGKLEDADPLYVRVLEILGATVGEEHPNYASALNNRAALLEAQGKYEQADPLYLRVIEMDEKNLGPNHPDLATSLNNRAGLLSEQGKYGEAGPLYERAMEIWERVHGPDHPLVATALNNRAALLESQGKYDEAGPLYERSLAIREKALGPDHPDVAQSLNNRAELLRAQGKHEEAAPLYERSLAIDEKVYGPDHLEVATDLNNWAALLESQGEYEQADPLYLRAIKIWEAALGPDHPQVATGLSNRAGLLEAQGKFEEADSLYLRAIEIGEKTLGPDHPDLATRLSNRAELLRAQGKHEEAAPLYERSLAIREKALGPDHPDVAQSLNNRAGLLEAQGSYDEAARLYQRSLAMWEKALGPDHPHVAVALNNLAGVVDSQGSYDEAAPLYQRCLAIREKVLGADHPDVATALSSLAGLFYSQGSYGEAAPLYQRSLAIRERALGPEHADVATSLHSLAKVYDNQGSYAEAAPLYKRSLAIREKTLGPEHPDVVALLNNLARLSDSQAMPTVEP